jgi:hypothetical protein
MDLPRDVVLKIVSKLDIDTRVKLGIIFKLKRSDTLVNELSRCLQTPSSMPDTNDWWCINLGPCVFSQPDYYTRYTLHRWVHNGSFEYIVTHAIEHVGTVNYETLS